MCGHYSFQLFCFYLLTNEHFKYILVVTMHIDDQKYSRKGKTYRRVLLRNSYRVDGKVRHDTIASLSKCSDEEIGALKIALKHKGNLTHLKNIQEEVETEQGLCVGAVWLLNQIAKKLGITKALGYSRESGLAQWLILSCLIEQGSRLSATRLAKRHAACDILGIEKGFNEDDLYEAMDWLESKQIEIEDRLFKKRYGNKTPSFYLYDVTSSYFEGRQNELADYGYNRDKKQGKMQIVIGLMTDDDGHPISVEVFQGNTQDPQTVGNQIKKMSERFGAKEVTLIGDRGMIKKAQIEELNNNSHKLNYITAITKPQVEKLIKEGVMQYELFDEDLVEIESENVRYLLRKNPIRAQEIENTRLSKIERLKTLITKENKYLEEHQKAKPTVAEKRVIAKSNRLKLNKVVTITTSNRIIKFEINTEELIKISRLDGCYVIKTDLKKEIISSEKVHARYKGLSVVENAFRTMKTALLEMRPIYVRKADRTKAHVFIIMLAYMIEHQLRNYWRDIDITVGEGISELASICSIKIKTKNGISYQTIPKPRELGNILLKAARIGLPTAIPTIDAIVDTRKKLVSEK